MCNCMRPHLLEIPRVPVVIVIQTHLNASSLQCQSRSRDCVYTPSRRGGPRCRKKPRPGRSDEPKQLPDDVFALLSQEPADVPRDRKLDRSLLVL